MSESNASTVSSEESAEQLIGTTISGRYKVEAVLGTGGMGAVYLVQHTHMRKRYALKVLHAETSKVPEMVARFEREAVASAHADHPNIAIATDFGRAESGAFFLVLEYLEGQRLRDVLASGPLEVGRAIHIAWQVASALERSHQLGIIHRDLKPENIMLVNRQGDDDFVKVLDFGLAKVAVETLAPAGEEPLEAITQHGTVFGTPRYMAPEQCVGEIADGRTDLYALGLILYEMLTGRHPFDGHAALQLFKHQLATPIPAMKTRAPGVSVPASLEALVLRLTEKKPEQRYGNATELLAALTEVCAREGMSPPETPSHLPPSAAKPAAAVGRAGSSGDDMTLDATPDPAVPDAALSAATMSLMPGSAGKSEASTPLAVLAGTQPPLAVDTAISSPPEPPTQPLMTASQATDPAQRSGSAVASIAEATTRPALGRAPIANSDSGPAASRARLPGLLARLPAPLQQSSFLLLVSLILLGLCLFLWLRPVSSPPTTPPLVKPLAAAPPRPAVKKVAASALATQAQLDQAIGAGAEALLTLSKQHPADARVIRALAQTYMMQRAGVEALRGLAQLLRLDASTVFDGEILQAATLAMNDPESGEAAIDLLENEFGARGVDILYALSTKTFPGRPSAKLKARLSQSFTNPELRAHAAPAVLIALDLRAATKCEAKRALLSRAAQEGDMRTLALLKPLLQKRGCGTIGRSDCWPCLRQGAALPSAVSAIAARASVSK